MTLEEKLEHLQASAMEEARTKGNEIMQSHNASLEEIYNNHKLEAERQAEVRIKSETTHAKQQLNTAMAKSQVSLKHELHKCQTELRTQLFQEVNTLVIDYMKTEEYIDLLHTYIMKAAAFADGKELTIFINPSDADKKDALEEQTGMTLTISKEDFIGGIRAVIQERNILIDHSFKVALNTQYNDFLFQGGDLNV
ncbi:MAG: V-type ATP synthase subunit E [Lachnospiraceae bacterium]